MSGVIPGGTARPPGSQPLFERARKRVTQRLSLAGLNSGGVGSAKFKIPAAEAAPAPVAAPAPPQEQVEAVLALPASVVIPVLPETVLLADAASLMESPQGQMDFRLPMGSILPMLPSGKIEFSIGDLSQCAPEGIIHSVESLGEWAAQTVLLPLPQVVMRISPEFMTLRRDQKQIDTAVASMDDPFSPEALRAKAEAAQSARNQEEPGIAPPADPAPAEEEASAPVDVVEPAPIEPSPIAEEMAPEAFPLPVDDGGGEESNQPTMAADLPTPDPEETPSTPEPDFSFTQSEEYKALLSKLQMAEEGPVPADAATEVVSRAPDFSPVPDPVPEPVAPPSVPAFVFPSPVKFPEPKVEPETTPDESLPSSPLSAAVTAAPVHPGSFQKALQGLVQHEAEGGKPPLHRSELHDLMRLPAEIPAGFKEFTRELSRWPGMKSCVICGPDGLPIASAGNEGKSGDSLAALAPRLFKNASALLADLGRTDLFEMNFPGEADSLTLFRNERFILITVHADEQLPTIYRQNIREALTLLAQSGPG